VLRLHQSRRADFRTGRPLGDGDRLQVWPKPPRKATCPLSVEQYAALPDALEVRMVRSTAALPGERVREMILVTTLRDPVRYPADALAAIFRRRLADRAELRRHQNHARHEPSRLPQRTDGSAHGEHVPVRLQPHPGADAADRRPQRAKPLPDELHCRRAAAERHRPVAQWTAPPDSCAVGAGAPERAHRRRSRTTAPESERPPSHQAKTLPISLDDHLPKRNENHPPPEKIPPFQTGPTV